MFVVIIVAELLYIGHLRGSRVSFVNLAFLFNDNSKKFSCIQSMIIQK